MESQAAKEGNLQQMGICGLLGKIFPPSCVLIGLGVCKALQEELAEQVGCISLKVRDSGVVSAEQDAFGSSLIHLNLGSSGFGGEVARTLVQILPFCPNLLHLDISANGLVADNISPPEERVSESLVHCTQLCHLSIGCNYTFDNDSEALLSVLEGCPALTFLDLYGTELGEDGIRALHEASSPSLSYLELSGGEISDESAELLAGAIGNKWKSLQHLGLGNMEQLGEDGACALAGCLGQCSALTHLDLGQLPCTDDIAVQLGRSLGALANLSFLCLRCIELSDRGWVQFARGMQGLSSLTQLDLEMSNLPDDGIWCLLPVLEGCHALTDLDLSSTKVGSDGVYHIARVIPSWPALRSLDLSECRVGDVGVQELVEASRHCTALQSLNLSRNHRMTEREVDILQRLCYEPLKV